MSFKRVGGSAAGVWNRPGVAQRCDYLTLVELTVEPCEMPQAGCGEGADLVVVVVE